MRPLDPLVADGPIRRPANPRQAARQRLNVSAEPSPEAKVRVRQALASASPPRRWASPRLRRRLRAGGAVLGVAGVALSLALGLPMEGFSKAQAGLLALAMEAGLKVGKITVTGRSDIPRAELLAALGVKQGDPILEIDTAAVRARLEQLGRVRTVSVTRLLPDTLHIELVERRPLAIWQNNGRHLLVDREGSVISGEVGNISGLPLVVGKGAPAHAARILTVISSEPKLAALVVAAVRVGERRWDVRLGNGITVRLPEVDFEGAWQRLAALERSHGLTGRAIDAVDMRLADRLVIHMLDDVPRSRLGPAKNT